MLARTLQHHRRHDRSPIDRGGNIIALPRRPDADQGNNRKRKEHAMEVDLPEVVAEVTAAFNRYEKALVTNDVAVLDDTFRVDSRTIRYGGSEILYGFDEIAAFRAARSPTGLNRSISRTVITTYGRDFAVASTLFHRETMPGKVGRQMQTWVRFPDGWHVVAAHVSVIDEKDVWKKP
jgi:hypothetical protein